MRRNGKSTRNNFRGGRKLTMLPGLMATAGAHVANQAVRYAAKRGAAYIAGTSAAGALGGYVYGRNHKNARRGKARGDRADGNGNAMTQMNITFGKKVVDKLPKVVRACVQSVLCRSQLVGQFDNIATATTAPGAITLQNTQNGVGVVQLPILLFDVTSWFNNLAGAVTYSQPVWYMSMTNLGVVSWNNVVAPWVLEDTQSPSSSTGTVPNQSDLLKWVSLKFNCYGATARPTKYSIDLISLKEDYLHPDQCNGAAPTTNSTTNVSYGTEQSTFWQSIVKPFVYNPIVVGNYKAGGKMKTYFHKEFILEEKLSTEPSVEQFTGHFKQVNIFMNMNRIQRYSWNTNGYQSATAQQTGGIMVDIANPTCLVAPKARLYVMVRATSTLGTVIDPTKHPSLDWVLRAKHENVV